MTRKNIVHVDFRSWRKNAVIMLEFTLSYTGGSLRYYSEEEKRVSDLIKKVNGDLFANPRYEVIIMPSVQDFFNEYNYYWDVQKGIFEKDYK